MDIIQNSQSHTLSGKPFPPATWNATEVDYSLDLCLLHQLFEAQVERTPDEIALYCPDATSGVNFLTFSQLNQRANQLARYLREIREYHAVEHNFLVGVFMDRSIEMVVSLYAILKAGGAYVPLDPEYPTDRVAYMLEETQLPVIVTQSHLRRRIPRGKSLVVCVDSEWQTIGTRSVQNLATQTMPESLAYVIYTSGSTGRPKGVMNTHRGICNRLLWMQDAFNLRAHDVVLQKTPFSFDVSVWEFFWPLLTGARLMIAKPGGHRDATYLCQLIQQQKITTIHFVPSMLRIFLEAKDVEQCTSLQRVICSGEALLYDLQQRFFARLNAELHNLYGPTEAAVDVTWWQCQRSSDFPIVPIGKPIANTQMHILDEQMQPVPIGETGELYIGGVQVARGYLNRPELTAERFIKDPFNPAPTARLYKTGDLARYLPDGNIDFLGRIDHQVKLHGFRIELGEIESVLAQHPKVRQAAVILYQKANAESNEEASKQLVAYFVADPRKGEQPSSGELRTYLLDKLPEYMVPNVYVVLPAMPLSPNGKLDHKQLPTPTNERPPMGSAYAAPRNPVEQWLATLWCEVLHLETVGIHDRFFELGGDSIQAAQFVNRLQKELGEFIYIVTIFDAPTIADYAALLERDYATALNQRFGRITATSKSRTSDTIDSTTVERFKACIPYLPSGQNSPLATKNPRAIFVLAPPRSGTTLLRVMLAGHPQLFAATELQLLGFNTLRERRSAYCGKFSLWLEGTLRALMEISGSSAEEAKEMMSGFEASEITTQQFYGMLQGWVGDRILVDKSPSYVLDPAALQKAESDFDHPFYIHLVRHPYAMVRSFENYHMDQVLYLKPHNFAPRQLGELVWQVSHQNTLDFLQTVPAERQIRISFEEMVRQPQVVMEALCQRTGIPFDPSLINPYQNLEKKMVNGIYADSNPMGDTHLLERQMIDPKVADQWQGVYKDNFLSESTWAIAQQFGYEKPEAVPLSEGITETTEIPVQALQPIQPVATQRRSIFDQRRQLRQQR